MLMSLTTAARRLARMRESPVLIARCGHGVPGVLESERQDVKQGRVVVDQEDVGHPFDETMRHSARQAAKGRGQLAGGAGGV
jgi:hypothetical protein